MRRFDKRTVLWLWIGFVVTAVKVFSAGPPSDELQRLVNSGAFFAPGTQETQSRQQALLYKRESSPESKLNPPLRVLLGFLIPGLPQYLDRKWRSYGYFAVEGVSIAGLVVLNSRGNSYMNRYINLARTARTNYVYPGLRNNPEELSDPSLPGYGEYYEDLLKWPSSGDYDNDPSKEGVQPETDPRTYNGHQWKIARINNYTLTNGGLPVPASPAEEARALEAYKSAVYPSAYNWDWTGLERENEEYHRLFDRSEDSFRRMNPLST